jgi:hypothetical protein
MVLIKIRVVHAHFALVAIFAGRALCADVLRVGVAIGIIALIHIFKALIATHAVSLSVVVGKFAALTSPAAEQFALAAAGIITRGAAVLISGTFAAIRAKFALAGARMDLAGMAGILPRIDETCTAVFAAVLAGIPMHIIAHSGAFRGADTVVRAEMALEVAGKGADLAASLHIFMAIYTVILLDAAAARSEIVKRTV